MAAGWPLPAFDVVPGAHGLGYQAMLVGDRVPNPRWSARCRRRASSGSRWTRRALTSEVAAKVAGWKEAFSAQGLAANDINLLAQYIDGDRLRGQREAFLAC